MRQVLLGFVITLSLLGCEEKTSNKTGTFIAGEIVNGNTNYLTLEKDNEFIDSIPIQENGRFSYQFKKENFKRGLYTFRYSPESQIFYVENGDSLLFRVNTKEFDESLMFTGDKAGENNFLMEMYLLNEKDNDLILSYYKISPKEFAQKTDSIKKSREKRLDKLQEQNEFSEGFLNLAEKTIDYEYYDLRERYAFFINRYFNEFRNKIPSNFFEYRSEVNFNDKELQSYYIYQRFLDNYLKNRAIELCFKQTNSQECFNTKSVTNLKNRLIISDSLFKVKNLRNRFITRFARKQINYADNETQIDSTLELLANFDLPKDQLQELKDLGKLQKNYFEGDNVSGAKLLSPDGTKYALKEILKKGNKPVITFTWSIYVSSHKRQHKRVNELRNRYPEVDFLGVNIDNEDSIELWRKALENFDYNKDFEYKIRERGTDFYLYKNLLNKILLIDKKGIIQKAGLNIYDPNFENQLLEFLNQ